MPKTLLALKRRRARGKGPDRLPPVALAGDDDPADAHRRHLPARLLAARLRARGPAGRRRSRAAPPRIDFVDCHLNLGTPTRQAIAATPPLADPHAYAHSIAKWAYALAVAERGLDCCDTQAMRDLMLGRRDDVFAFVGTPVPARERVTRVAARLRRARRRRRG